MRLDSINQLRMNFLSDWTSVFSSTTNINDGLTYFQFRSTVHSNFLKTTWDNCLYNSAHSRRPQTDHKSRSSHKCTAQFVTSKCSMLPTAQIFIANLDKKSNTRLWYATPSSGVGAWPIRWVFIWLWKKTLTKGRQLCGQIMAHFHGTKPARSLHWTESSRLSKPTA